MISLTFFLWRWWVWNFWLRTWRSTLCGYGPSMVQVCHNAESYASAKGLGPDFFLMLQFPISFWNTKKWGKDTNWQRPMWNEHLVRVHLAAPPTWKTCRESWHLADGFWKTSAVWRKSGSRSWCSNPRWVLIDTEPFSTFVVSNTCIKITFLTQVDLSNLGYSQLSSKLGGPDSTRFRTCGSSFFGELQQSCSSMVEIVAWSA